MFSNKTALAACVAIGAMSLMRAAYADEKHLTLDDIDGLARQHLVDSMRKTDSAQAQSSGLNTQLPGAGAAPVQPVATVVQPVVVKPKREAAPIKQVPVVNFVGAYGDASGSHYVLYDYQGGIYPAQAGAKLLNGWTVARVDGYTVTVSYGKRTWTEVISPPVAAIPVTDSTSVQAITDLGGPLPPGGLIPSAMTSNAPGGRPTFIPLGK